MSSLQKSVLKSKLPPPSVSSDSRLTKSKGFQRKRGYEPVPWTPYFDESKDISIGDNIFHIYLKGSEGPTLVLLHGGGYSALTWAEFTKSIMTMIICRVIAIDLRGHGDSHTTDEDDLSADTLAADVAGVVQAVVEDNQVILLGHSMGGAVAVRAAPLIPNLSGLGVIDVVEGTAMDALGSMKCFLRTRPASFKSISQAIEWCVRSGQIRNIQSAKVSVPGQIKNVETGKLATHDIDSPPVDSSCDCTSETILPCDDVIKEEKSSTSTPLSSSAGTCTGRHYEWRIDLAKTEEHWFGWFKGMSAAFLNVLVPKMLLLAGVDRLDRELTIGQMQGKFQMQLLPACGHAVHEDVPDKVAEAIASFMVRHKFAEPTSGFHRTSVGW